MTRGRLGLLLFGVCTVIVLALGLTRPTNEPAGGDGDDEPTPSTTGAISGVGGDLGGRDPILQPADETIEVVAGDDCRAVIRNDSSPSCQAFAVNGVEFAWVVEQDRSNPPVASFLRRDRDTQWTRVLEADGAGDRGFDLVNVRIDDLTGDGEVEAVFGFHQGTDLSVDVVETTGAVLLHLDLGSGHILVGGGLLIAWTRDGDQWKREEIRFVDGKSEVVATEVIDGPAEGNL